MCFARGARQNHCVGIQQYVVQGMRGKTIVLVYNSMLSWGWVVKSLCWYKVVCCTRDGW